MPAMWSAETMPSRGSICCGGSGKVDYVSPEAMNLSFELPDTIQVVRQRSSVVPEIPGKRQNNRRQQTIPTFVDVLRQARDADRLRL